MKIEEARNCLISGGPVVLHLPGNIEVLGFLTKENVPKPRNGNGKNTNVIAPTFRFLEFNKGDIKGFISEPARTWFSPFEVNNALPSNLSPLAGTLQTDPLTLPRAPQKTEDHWKLKRLKAKGFDCRTTLLGHEIQGMIIPRKTPAQSKAA